MLKEYHYYFGDSNQLKIKPMRAIVTIFTLLLLSTFSSQLFACFCVGQRTVQEEIKSSDALIVGTVLKKEIVTLTDSTSYPEDSTINFSGLNQMIVARYDVLVEDIYKGNITTDTITIYSGLGGRSCGVNFEVGKKYIIYGELETYFGQTNNDIHFPKGENNYWTYNCLRTTSYYDKEIAEIEQFASKRER